MGSTVRGRVGGVHCEGEGVHVTYTQLRLQHNLLLPEL